MSVFRPVQSIGKAGFIKISGSSRVLVSLEWQNSAITFGNN